MDQSTDLLIFKLDEHQYALRLAAVERVIRAVAVTALPKAPISVCGVVNVHGAIVSVINLRLRLGLAQRPIDIADQFIIARTARRRVILVSDAVVGVVKVADREITAMQEITPGLSALQAVAKLGAEMLFIYDLDRFLSAEETIMLDDALEAAQI
jgi:purine-binding chemotaxis protein CheW